MRRSYKESSGVFFLVNAVTTTDPSNTLKERKKTVSIVPSVLESLSDHNLLRSSASVEAG